ncbi:hypothetical protein [Amorphus sp. MBR-141]
MNELQELIVRAIQAAHHATEPRSWSDVLVSYSQSASFWSATAACGSLVTAVVIAHITRRALQQSSIQSNRDHQRSVELVCLAEERSWRELLDRWMNCIHGKKTYGELSFSEKIQHSSLVTHRLAFLDKLESVGSLPPAEGELTWLPIDRMNIFSNKRAMIANAKCDRTKLDIEQAALRHEKWRNEQRVMGALYDDEFVSIFP